MIALIRQILTDAHNRGNLGDTPYRECQAFLDSLAPVADGVVREAPAMKGRNMITWEGPADVFDRLVLNDRLYRKSQQRSD